MRVGDVDDLSVDQDLAARVRLVGAREHFHQGALAGAVLAHQGLDFPAPGFQLHIAESFGAGKGLGDAAHLQGRRTHTLCRRVVHGRSHGFLQVVLFPPPFLLAVIGLGGYRLTSIPRFGLKFR